MTSTEKWNKVCEYFENYRNEPEEKVQFLWERLFSEIFGYSLLDKEIDSHRKIQLGSTERLIPDIIIKNSESDLFMVELKRENLEIDETRKKQLYSYLKQEQNDLGILICNQICIIDYDYNTSDDNQVCCIIDFTKDNPNGIKFIEIFEKTSFSKAKAKEFIKQCIDSSTKIRDIQQQLTPELIKTLVIEYFSKNFSEADIQLVISRYDFLLALKENTPKVLSINNSPYVKNNTNSSTAVPEVQKTNTEKLIREIRSVGMETFIKYFEYYNNNQYETRDIKELFRGHENWSENSMASKASTGKGIIKRGNAKDALSIIANASNIDYSVRRKAQEYLEKL